MPHRLIGSPQASTMPGQAAIKPKEETQPDMDNTKMEHNQEGVAHAAVAAAVAVAEPAGHHRSGSHGSAGSGATRVDAADDEAHLCEEESDEVSAGEGSSGPSTTSSTSTHSADSSTHMDSSNPSRRPRRRPRRSTGELELNERWICPKGCGKIYRKNSTVSIRKHVPYCVGPVVTPPSYALPDPMQMMYSAAPPPSFEHAPVVPACGSAPHSPPLHYAASLPPRALTSPEQHQQLLTQHYAAQSHAQPTQQSLQQPLSQPPSPQQMPTNGAQLQQQAPQPMLTQQPFVPTSPPSSASLLELQHHQAQLMQQQQMLHQRHHREHTDHMRALQAHHCAQLQMQHMHLQHQLQQQQQQQESAGAKMLSALHNSTPSSTPLSRVISPLSLVKLGAPSFTAATRMTLPHSAFKAVIPSGPLMSCKEEVAAASYGYGAATGSFGGVGQTSPPMHSAMMPSALPMHPAQYHCMNGALRRVF